MAATASFLESKGIIPDYLPDTFTSEGIVEILKAAEVTGKKFLLPRAEEARDIIVKFIKNKGGICDVIPIYRTALPKHVAPLDEKPDIVTFTSSSTAKTCYPIRKKRPQRYKDSFNRASTTKTLKNLGFTAHIEAKRYDIQGLVEAIIEFVKK